MTNLDELHMREALDLARAGIALTSPNPCVGAVIVDDAGKVVGSGSHTYDGLKHAETLAIEQAGSRARGATLYVNLEPCSHQGRTPPCANAILSAGIIRVVAAMEDPNPLVAGQGFAQLRDAGVHVEVGILKGEAQKLNEAFARYIRHKTPLITLKTAMTLDGKIAPEPSPIEVAGPGNVTRGWITSDFARKHVQQLRHQHDAILVGVGTILADDPLLTDRTGLPRRRPLLRVILDSRLRLPPESRLVQHVNADVLVLCSILDIDRKRALENRGVRVEQVAAARPDGRPDFRTVARHLGEQQITSLLIEGGATVNWDALAAGVVDKIFFYYAPKILAGSGSVPFAVGEGFRRMSDAAHVKSIAIHRFGEDFAVEGYLKDPYV
jgi:diaminohydroxyphosphoribosylaminopyrimidine deaminase/5-amino-6-(5-phosphoribosylamino)uracil reductase